MAGSTSWVLFLLSFILHPNHERYYGRKVNRIISATYPPARHRIANIRCNRRGASETKRQRGVYFLQSGQLKTRSPFYHFARSVQHVVDYPIRTSS